MDALRQFFARFTGQTSQFWGGLSGSRKAIAGAVVVIVVLGFGALWLSQDSDPWVYVFEQLDSKDRQGIIDYFSRNNITEWRSDERGIKVPPESVLQLRLDLTMEGIPSGGVVGWEVLDQQDFTRTEDERGVLKLRAIQGELARTIMRIDKINSARVHIVKPRDRVFKEDQKDPTAAVFLKSDRDFDCDARSVRGIVQLVSKSVEGLEPRNVSVLDSDGRMCTEPEPDDFASKLTKQRLQYKKALEQRYEKEIRKMVGRAVGPDRVEVSVNVEVDLTQENETISDVDPDRFVVLSKQTTGYKLKGKGLNPTGVPGAQSNVPGEEEELAVNGSSTDNTKDSELINYQPSTTTRVMTKDPGGIVRLSAAVLVDGKQEYPIDGSQPEFEPRTEEEMKSIEDLTKKALSFNEKRGDTITVRNMMFQLDPFQIQSIKEEKQETREYISTLAISGAVALSLVLFFAFIVRPYFRWLSYDPERKQAQQKVEEFKPDLELGTLQNVQVKEDVPFEKLSPQEQVHFLAKNEPQRTTEAIRLLLNPHHNG